MKETRKSHDDAIKHCRQAKLNRMKLTQQKNAEAKDEAYIEAMDYIEQYHSGHCWKTPEQAREEYEMLDSESKHLRAVKSKYLSIARDSAGRMLAIIFPRMDTHSHQKSYLIISQCCT